MSRSYPSITREHVGLQEEHGLWQDERRFLSLSHICRSEPHRHILPSAEGTEHSFSSKRRA